MGSRSRSTAVQSNTQTTDTTSLGLQDIEGTAVAAQGDVEITQNISDQGAIENAFGFADSFSENAFEFANDVSAQASNLSERAIETSQQALATSVTGGKTDLAGIDSKTIAIVAAAFALIMIVPQFAKGK